jgi:hypothetical protein
MDERLSVGCDTGCSTPDARYWMFESSFTVLSGIPDKMGFARRSNWTTKIKYPEFAV